MESTVLRKMIVAFVNALRMIATTETCKELKNKVSETLKNYTMNVEIQLVRKKIHSNYSDNKKPNHPISYLRRK